MFTFFSYTFTSEVIYFSNVKFFTTDFLPVSITWYLKLSSFSSFNIPKYISSAFLKFTTTALILSWTNSDAMPDRVNTEGVPEAKAST